MPNNQLQTRAGRHYIIDLWYKDGDEGKPFPCLTGGQQAIDSAIKAANATKINEHYHQFEGGIGFTGVACLAESHISIHTWPELGVIAVDIFMCGDSDIDAAKDTLLNELAPDDLLIREFVRG